MHTDTTAPARGRTLARTTIDGVTYSIDADGAVMAPDADGLPDQLNIGRVTKSGRDWLADTPRGKLPTPFKSRTAAITMLAHVETQR